MIFKKLKNRTTTVLADKKNKNGNQPKNENRVAVVNPNGNSTSISTRTSTSISRRQHGGGGGRYSNEKGGMRGESPATTAFATATSTSTRISTTNQMLYPVSPYDEMPHIRPLVQKLVPPSSVRSKSFDSSPRRNSICGQQPEEFRQDVDRCHRHHRYRTQQQQEGQNDDSKRNETINTRVRERAEAREGGGGGDEPRDRPPLSFNYRIQKIKNTNVSVVVSNSRRRTSIMMMTNGNKDGTCSNNSNDAHTVPFMIEIPSSCLYLVSSEDYSDVTIDDDDADARDQSVLMVQQHRLSYDDDDKLMKQWKEQVIWPSDEDRS